MAAVSRQAGLALLALAALALVCPTAAQPFGKDQGLLPSGNLRTSDEDGPYDISLLSTQAHEVRAAQAFRNGFTDRDIVDFLVNVECLEGQFDMYGAFGHGFFNNLSMGGPKPLGARKANLSPEVLPFAQEIALSEQGHALFTRQAGSTIPCPVIDFVGGFNGYFASAYNLPAGTTIKDKFGKDFDPFLNDETFLLSQLSLEENGATGNKGLAGILGNPVIATSVAGLATSATAFAAIERKLLWERRKNIVEPFGETVEQVFARVSAMRDHFDGPPISDQGLTNSDGRFIAVPAEAVNMIPTDIRGITFNRTPAQVINILTQHASGKGLFFPEGLNGKINSPKGYDQMASGDETWPHLLPKLAKQASVKEAGIDKLADPITPDSNPHTVPGQFDLNGNDQRGHITTAEPETRHTEL
jgi:hypothetical protein